MTEYYLSEAQLEEGKRQLAEIEDRNRRERERSNILRMPSSAEQAQSVSPKPASPPITPATPESWPEMDPAAYYGLAGDFVRAMEPHTEADSAGLLVQFLVAFGNIIGPEPYYLVESDKHHANLFALLVGNSSRGRKGTSGGSRAAYGAGRR